MARTPTVILAEIKTAIRTYPTLNSFKFPEDGGSQVSVFNLIIGVVAMAIFTFEVILDQLKSDIQAIADKAPSGNNKWVQAQMFKFQYGDVVTLTNFIPGYAVINPANQIITQCAVKDIGNGTIAIKLATGATAPFTPLTSPQLIAVKNYYYGTSSTQGIGFAGVKASFITLNPDRMFVQANIYFQGQYTQAVISSNVITAINAFLQSFAATDFDGRILMINLVDSIQAVAGVTRVELVLIKARAATVALGSATTIPIQGYYDTVAGHIISEDTGGSTLADTLTFIPEL